MGIEKIIDHEMDEDDPKTKKNRLLAKDMMGAAPERVVIFFSRKVTCSCLKDKYKRVKNNQNVATV